MSHTFAGRIRTGLVRLPAARRAVPQAGIQVDHQPPDENVMTRIVSTHRRSASGSITRTLRDRITASTGEKWQQRPPTQAG